MTTSVYFGMALLESLVDDQTTSLGLKLIASLSPTVALSQSLTVLTIYESSGLGLTWSTLGRWYLNYNLQVGIGMMAFDVLLWYALGLLFEILLPKTYGVQVCRRKQSKVAANHESKTNKACFEPVSGAIAQRDKLKVAGLWKEYANGCKAVNGLSVEMFKD